MSFPRTSAYLLAFLIFTLLSCESRNKKENNLQSNETVEANSIEPEYMYQGEPLRVAIIVLTYPKTQVVIQASWNWSHNRKDMAVYGTHGYVFCKNGKDMEVLENEKAGSKLLKA